MLLLDEMFFLPVVLINKTEEKPFLKSADSKVSKTCDVIRVRTNWRNLAFIVSEIICLFIFYKKYEKNYNVIVVWEEVVVF